MSRARMPVMPSSGMAQKGWKRFVWASPTANAMVALPTGTPMRWAASMTEGPMTVHSPPPDGTKMLTMPAESTDSSPYDACTAIGQVLESLLVREQERPTGAVGRHAQIEHLREFQLRLI